MNDILKAELPLLAADLRVAISRVMAAWSRSEMSSRRFRSWLMPDLAEFLELSEFSDLLDLPRCAFLILRVAPLPKRRKSEI